MIQTMEKANGRWACWSDPALVFYGAKESEAIANWRRHYYTIERVDVIGDN